MVCTALSAIPYGANRNYKEKGVCKSDSGGCSRPASPAVTQEFRYSLLEVQRMRAMENYSKKNNAR
jgi:hypothetical protein